MRKKPIKTALASAAVLSILGCTPIYAGMYTGITGKIPRDIQQAQIAQDSKGSTGAGSGSISGSQVPNPISSPIAQVPVKLTRLGPAASSTFIQVDNQGNIYLLDSRNSCIWKASEGQEFKKFYVSEYTGDPKGAERSAKGPFYLWMSKAFTVGNDGSIYVADWYGYCIRKISPNGQVTAIGGDVNDASTLTVFRNSLSIAVDDDNTLYVGDAEYHVIWKVTPDGKVIKFAGTYGKHFGGEGYGTFLPNAMSNPRSIAIDDQKRLAVTDSGIIWRIDNTGNVQGLVGKANLKDPNTFQPVDFGEGPKGVLESLTSCISRTPSGVYLVRTDSGIFSLTDSGILSPVGDITLVEPSSNAVIPFSIRTGYQFALSKNGRIYFLNKSEGHVVSFESKELKSVPLGGNSLGSGNKYESGTVSGSSSSGSSSGSGSGPTVTQCLDDNGRPNGKCSSK